MELRCKQQTRVEHTMKRLLCSREVRIHIGYLIASITGGYLIAHFLIPFIPVNSDSYAPIQQAQTLIQAHATNLFSIHLARIPSLFPDLIILSGLKILLPLKGGLDLLSIYAWIYSSLFIFICSYLIKEVIAPKKLNILEPLSFSIICIGLIAISPTARHAYGHLLTPVHHGGNILNTLIIFVLAIKLTKNQHSRSLLILFTLIATLAIASNKLFLFTALIPCIYLLRNRLKSKWVLGWTAMMITLGWGLGAAFNAQCSPEISVNISTGLNIINQYWIDYTPIIVASILSIASLAIIFVNNSKKEKLNIIVTQELEDALTAISLSCLTFYIYIFLLSGSGEVTVRYALIFFISIPLFISLLIHSITKTQKDYWLICLIGLIVSIAHKPGYIARKINRVKERPINEMMLFRYRDPKSELNKTLIFLGAKNLKKATGLSEYWGAGMALESNTQLSIFPVHSSGVPDYWSMSPETLIKGINSAQQEFYVISKNTDFITNIKSSLGQPLEHWSLNSKTKTYQLQEDIVHQTPESTQLLIYKDDVNLKRIRNHAKLFKRDCDINSPLHKVR